VWELLKFFHGRRAAAEIQCLSAFSGPASVEAANKAGQEAAKSPVPFGV